MKTTKKTPRKKTAAKSSTTRSRQRKKDAEADAAKIAKIKADKKHAGNKNGGTKPKLNSLAELEGLLNQTRGKLSTEIINQISGQVEKGTPLKYAAAMAGVSERAVYNWMDEAKEVVEALLKADREEGKDALEEISRLQPRQQLALQFLQSVKKAEATAIANNLLVIQVASQESWQAAGWYLERRHPEEFSLTQRHEHTGANGGPMLNANLNLGDLKDEISPESLAGMAQEFLASNKEEFPALQEAHGDHVEAARVRREQNEQEEREELERLRQAEKDEEAAIDAEYEDIEPDPDGHEV